MPSQRKARSGCIDSSMAMSEVSERMRKGYLSENLPCIHKGFEDAARKGGFSRYVASWFFSVGVPPANVPIAYIPVNGSRTKRNLEQLPMN